MCESENMNVVRNNAAHAKKVLAHLNAKTAAHTKTGLSPLDKTRRKIYKEWLEKFHLFLIQSKILQKDKTLIFSFSFQVLYKFFYPIVILFEI
jgi:hypothetical protein